MSMSLVGILLGALTAYSYMFIRRCGEVQHNILLPFMHRMHAPNVLNTITEEEHDGIHRQIDIFNIRIITCFLASIVAVGVTLLFLILLTNGGNAQIAGYIMAITFAYVVANYDLNSKIIKWVYFSENELLSRVIQDKSDKSEFDNLGDYLKNESDKMLMEWHDEVLKVGEDYEARLIELGYDPERDYLENPEAEEELIRMLEQVSNEFEEKLDKTPDK